MFSNGRIGTRRLGAGYGPEAQRITAHSAAESVARLEAARPRPELQRFSARVDPDLRRPTAAGKFLSVGDRKLWVRGVTYGAFRPDAEGNEYQCRETIRRDFARIAANGLNAVRIPHTTPPRALLDIAQQNGLHVMVGLSAEQYAGFLIDAKGAPDVEALVRAKVRASAGHPALLCYSLGNEIPASLVRWLGRRRIERYLERLHRAVKAEDPEGLVTYTNYPTTEYLQLPFLDLVSFNVYLESQERLEAYLARLQNLAGERPLLMSEVGLDSLRHGEDAQAHVLEWQLRTAFRAGCAGAFVFAWTDEWHRAGAEVEDWAFGLTDRERRPKRALAAVRRAFSSVPFPKDARCPRISVIVCTFNGSRTIRDCLEGLCRLDYPNYEVIVVNDGSTDSTGDIVEQYGFRVIHTRNEGLSSARNRGLAAATGEIVAYIDDDAWPDPDWLTYLAATFTSTFHVGVGGPNVAPPGDGATADCVAHSPGNPTHVLLSDLEAEHLPGCNMAFRKEALEAIGGFDPQFRAAGDDVDLCWRLQERGGTLGFSPAAVVWHHRRGSIRAFWKQQLNYGAAEALLERKWPEKYNAAGHLSWAGRVYGNGFASALGRRTRIYYGPWGSAPFQSLSLSAPGKLESLVGMPEWYLVIAGLAGLSALGLSWRPLLLAAPLLAFAVAALLVQAVLGALRASLSTRPNPRLARLKMRALTAFLHLAQPLARLTGRLRDGLTPWRRRSSGFAFPWSRTTALWCERWQDPLDRLRSTEKFLRASGASIRRGGDYDRWDLEVHGGMFGCARLLMAVEDHGAGTQLVRLRSWPKCSTAGLVTTAVLSALATAAGCDGAWGASASLALGAVMLCVRMLLDSARAAGALRRLPVEKGTE